jgi:hypothetical protein
MISVKVFPLASVAVLPIGTRAIHVGTSVETSSVCRTVKFAVGGGGGGGFNLATTISVAPEFVWLAIVPVPAYAIYRSSLYVAIDAFVFIPFVFQPEPCDSHSTAQELFTFTITLSLVPLSVAPGSAVVVSYDI